MKTISLLLPLLITSCSFIGIQSEEGPKYKVLKKESQFEIRQYEPYIVAKTTVRGDFKESTRKAFRILAGYIFGKNKGEKKISMTSPVEIESSSSKIPMTSPVEMSYSDGNYTMAFSMPSKYSIDTLPKPLDERIKFEEIPQKIIASHQYSWLSSKKRNDKKAEELRKWLKKQTNYKVLSNYRYAGYNPPWTIPFFRRNEVHILIEVINLNTK